MPLIISKSKYLAGLQCPLLLWYHFNEKKLFPPIDEATQATFDQGHEVGEWAKKLFPDGVEVAWGDFTGTLEQTKELVAEKKTVFEASFLFNHCYCRCDVLVPQGDAWDIIEVKSGSKVKEENLEDVAFQRYVLEGCGLKIRKCFLMHVNSDYVRDGEIDPDELLKKEDVTEAAGLLLPEVPGKVKEQFKVIGGPKPDVEIGPQCSAPYGCALKEHCWKFLPPDNVTELYFMGKKAFPLIDADHVRIADVPFEKLTDKQRIQQEAVVTGKRHVDKKHLKKWLSGLRYPLYHFDFETVSSAVPLFDKSSPYQQVPFQFSLHIQQEGGSVEHHEFLHTELSDPRPALISAMKAIGDTGTILAFNMGFEKGRITEMARDFPDEKEFLLSLNDRFDDLIIPFRNFWVHDAAQHGSNSIKDVLPAYTTTSYSGMAICEGSQAARKWLRAVRGAEDKEKIFEALRKYCRQDTQAMIDVLGELEALVKAH